jgi:hypothetical protein
LAEAARLCAEAVDAAIGQPPKPDVLAKQLAQLVEKAKTAEMQPEDLDEEGHDVAASIAANVNNSGLDRQLAFLLGEMGYEGTSARLDELVKVMHTAEP